MITTPYFSIKYSGRDDALWTYVTESSNRQFDVAPPSIEIDGVIVTLLTQSLDAVGAPVSLANDIQEQRFEGGIAGQEGLTLALIVRTSKDSTFVRFHYEVLSDKERRLTKATGRDTLVYTRVSLVDTPSVREVRFSEFNEFYHSFCLAENDLDSRHFDNGVAVMGPILVASDGDNSVLFAYEHGSQLPDRFIEFSTSPDRTVEIRAVKGNYYDGQRILPGVPFRTIWLQIGAVTGDMDDLAAGYRSFVLCGMSTNAESRKPYVFYNTWNYQERNQGWNKSTYLDSMNQERILAEIDVAHRMGIDVFVIDTGWYEKTGDWRVSRERFPDGLDPIKAKLDGYGMKLGLWFNPVIAAVSSSIRAEHDECVMSRDGKQSEPHEVWETEASQGMCLVSRYADAFADELIRLYNEVGVTYFKWDAIDQYGCNDPSHHHGTAGNSDQERSDCYGFSLITAMASVVERLCKVCPEAIVDFDITEGGRAVGLSFLSVGKYFLINNGPYYHNYDIPAPEGRNINMFFYPGTARGWICRKPLAYDRWIPSILFLAHYFPDDPAENQWTTLASLMLGHNGIWGDLLTVSDEGVSRLSETLARYKNVRDDVTAASPVFSGEIGSSLEVHEKLSDNGRGLVSLFSNHKGNYTYVTQNVVVTQHWQSEGTSVSFDSQGRAVIEVVFDKPSARIVFFGA
jgi:alpha-galactosidase